jgi:hypothetical protein
MNGTTNNENCSTSVLIERPLAQDDSLQRQIDAQSNRQLDAAMPITSYIEQLYFHHLCTFAHFLVTLSYQQNEVTMNRDEMIDEVIRLALLDDLNIDQVTLRNELGQLTPTDLEDTYTVFVESQAFIDRLNKPFPSPRRQRL